MILIVVSFTMIFNVSRTFFCAKKVRKENKKLYMTVQHFGNNSGFLLLASKYSICRNQQDPVSIHCFVVRVMLYAPWKILKLQLCLINTFPTLWLPNSFFFVKGFYFTTASTLKSFHKKAFMSHQVCVYWFL